MFLISLIVFCVVVLFINRKDSINNKDDHIEFFNKYIAFIRRCVYRIGYTTFEIKQNGIFEGKRVWWLFHIEGYDDLSDEQCVIFAKIAIDQLELLHPGHVWGMQTKYKDKDGEIVFDYIRVFPVREFVYGKR